MSKSTSLFQILILTFNNQYNMKLEKRDVDTIIGLTPTQEGILFHYLLDNSNYQYFEQTCIYVLGELNIDTLRRAWLYVTQANEMLRTSFAWKKIKKPVQVIWKKWELRYEHIDLSKLSPEEQEGQVDLIRSKDRSAGFDLEDHAFRIKSFQLASGRALLMFSNHSILFDGWSFNVILNEFFDTYARVSSNGSLVRSDKTQFRDYIKWQQSTQTDNGKKYWRQYLQGVEIRQMPLKEKIQVDIRHETGVHLLRIPGIHMHEIETLGRTFGFSPSAFFYTMWGLFLQKLLQEDDVVFGATFSGRSAPLKGIEAMVGNFLNSLPIRFKSSDDDTVLSSIRKVSNDIQDKIPFEHTSLLKIKEYADVKLRGDLFDSLILFENHPMNETPESSGAALRVESFTFEHASHFDITLFILRGSAKYEIHFSYNKARFKPQTISRLASYFEVLIINALKNIHANINTISILPAAELERIVYQFNQTVAPYNRNANLKDLLEEKYGQFSARIAVQCNHYKVTYDELHARANKISWNLKAELGNAKNYIGLVVDRSVEMIVAVIAAVKAGYAYVPIDAMLPIGRMKKIVDDTGIRSIITSGIFQGKAEALVNECKSIDSVYSLSNSYQVLRKPFASWAPIDETKEDNLASGDSPEDIAYVIFTSGSTGVPKGVVVQHRPVVNIVEWINKTLNITEHDTVLCVASLGFDLSVYDIFGTLSQGGTLSIATYDDLASPEALLQKLIRERITVWNSAPAVLQNIIQWNELQRNPHRGEDLRVVMLSGDWIGLSLPGKVKKYFEQAEVVSLGGATEATVWSNYYRLREVDPEWNSIPYGKPIQNCAYYVLDRNLAPCPIGIVGDLYISGECLALGYINDIELTYKKFIANPFLEGFMMYATGDLARWYADGNMELIGRKDNQIKIRGYRIELGEIESQLREISGVEDALAVVNINDSGEKSIWAYYLAQSTRDVDAMKARLAEVLPAYMIPLHLIWIDKFPVTSNGKVDRKKLPLPSVEIVVQEKEEETSDPLRMQIISMWSEILKIPVTSIGVKSNFFELGGHSLNITELMARLANCYSISIQMKEVFMSPTVEGMASIVSQNLGKEEQVIKRTEKKEYYPLTSSQLRMYAIQENNSMGIAYNIVGGAIIKGDLDAERVESALQKIVEIHESLRTSFRIVQNDLVQYVEDQVTFKLEQYSATKDSIDRIIKQFIRPFDLEKAPLMRSTLVKTEPNEYYFLFDLHHIIADGYSLKRIMEDFCNFYEGKGIIESPLQYADFAEWVKRPSYRKMLAAQKEYWHSAISTITRLNLPLDFVRPADLDYSGDKVCFAIGEGQVAKIKALATEEKTTMFTVVLSIFNVFLSKICKEDDVIVGTPVIGRNSHQLARTIGMFVNTVILRNHVPKNKMFLSFVRDVRSNVIEAFKYDDVPFDYIVQTVDKDHLRNRNPVFDVAFEYDNLNLHQMNIQGLDIEIKDDLAKRAKFDLTLEVIELENILKCSFEYRVSLFRRETIEWLTDKFLLLTDLLAKNPRGLINEADIITKQYAVSKEAALDFNF